MQCQEWWNSQHNVMANSKAKKYYLQLSGETLLHSIIAASSKRHLIHSMLDIFVLWILWVEAAMFSTSLKIAASLPVNDILILIPSLLFFLFCRCSGRFETGFGPSDFAAFAWWASSCPSISSALSQRHGKAFTIASGTFCLWFMLGALCSFPVI